MCHPFSSSHQSYILRLQQVIITKNYRVQFTQRCEVGITLLFLLSTHASYCQHLLLRSVSGSHCVQPAGGLHDKKWFRDCMLRTTEPLSARDLSATGTSLSYFRSKVFMYYFLRHDKNSADAMQSELILRMGHVIC